MTNIELLDLIREEFYRIQPEGCFDFFRKRDRRIPCLPNLQKRFGKTYNEILLMAGVKDDDLNFVRRNNEEYLNKLKEVILKLGYVPSITEFNSLGYSASILKRYYGSYANAVKKLDCEEYRYKTPVSVNESKVQLLEKYVDFSNKIGKPASWLDLEKSSNIYNPGVFTIRFGGMKDLKREAGFEVINKNNEIYNKKDIQNKLIQLYKEKGKRLSVKEINESLELPCLATILRKYKTTKISEVWEEIESRIA